MATDLSAQKAYVEIARRWRHMADHFEEIERRFSEKRTPAELCRVADAAHRPNTSDDDARYAAVLTAGPRWNGNSARAATY